MEKITKRRTEAMDLDFKHSLQDLVDRSGFSLQTFSDLLGVSTSQLGAWLNPRDDAMPSGPAYRLIRMALSEQARMVWPVVLGQLSAIYYDKHGHLPKFKKPAGRPKTRGRSFEDCHSQT
jgi:DNA-binding transcriptional regulator YiaG